jgi:hypothetical protein
MNYDIALGILAGIPVGGIITSVIYLRRPVPNPVEPEHITELIETVRQTTNLDAVQRNHAMQLRRAQRKTMRTDNTNEPARVYRLRSGKMPRESKWGADTNTSSEPPIILEAKAIEGPKSETP